MCVAKTACRWRRRERREGWFAKPRAATSMSTSVNVPADSHESAPLLQSIPLPRRLFVPLLPATNEQAKVLAAGTRVRRGEPIVSGPIADRPLPLAPADG